MNIEKWALFLKSNEGKKETAEIWSKIRINYYNQSFIFLEYLVLRIILTLDGFENPINTVGNLILDKEFKPIACAGSGVRDLYVKYEDIGYVLEVTQRPILGKVEHWDHLNQTRDEFHLSKVIGLLISQLLLEDIDENVWVIYTSHLSVKPDEMFMICDLDFLMRLLEKENPFEIFKDYLIKSKEIWEIEKKYNIIREQIISLKEQIIKQII